MPLIVPPDFANLSRHCSTLRLIKLKNTGFDFTDSHIEKPSEVVFYRKVS